MSSFDLMPAFVCIHTSYFHKTYLEVQFEEEFDDGGLQDELLPRGPRPKRRVLVGLEHGDQLLWQVHVDERPERGKGTYILS